MRAALIIVVAFAVVLLLTRGRGRVDEEVGDA